jgi:hypothetical protein
MSDSANGKKAITAGLIALSVILSVTSLMLYNKISDLKESLKQVTKVNEEKVTEVDGLVIDLEQKKQEYADLIVKHEELGLDVEDLQFQYEALSEEIVGYKSALRRKDVNYRELKEKMADAAAMHRLELKNKQKEIAFLETQNDSLVTTSEQLDRSFKAQKEVLKRKNEKIGLASVLRAENIQVFAKDLKQKEIIKQPFKGKKIEYLVINFKIADNKVAPYNKKSLAIRLVGPDDAVLYDLSYGGGSMKTATNETIFYTMKQSLLFDNSNQKIVFPYQKQGLWSPGQYTAQIYGDGYQIGKLNFQVK